MGRGSNRIEWPRPTNTGVGWSQPTRPVDGPRGSLTGRRDGDYAAGHPGVADDPVVEELSANQARLAYALMDGSPRVGADLVSMDRRSIRPWIAAAGTEA